VSVEDGELYLDGALPLPTSLMEQLRLRKGALLDYLSATAPVRELAPSVTAPSAPNCSVTVAARARDPQTGDLVPRRLAMATPSPEAEFTAQLSPFNSSSIAQEVGLVDILCPASSGGMKGLSFRVSQLPGLLRVLLEVHDEAIAARLLEVP